MYLLSLLVLLGGFLFFRRKGPKALRNFLIVFAVLFVVLFGLLLLIPAVVGSSDSGDSVSTNSSDTDEPAYYDPQSTYSNSGTGDTVLRSISVSLPSSLHFQTHSDGNNVVKAYYGDSDYDCDLLVNAIDSYDGYTYLIPGRTYDFEISCDGKWNLEIFTVGFLGEKYFVGTDDCVTNIIQPLSKYYTINYNGEGNFVVKQWYGTGEHDYDLLVNEIGEYSGTVRISKASEKCFFEVIADNGVWSIRPST